MKRFRRVLIANRGAIARRVIRACDALGIESVAVFSEADGGAPYLGEATATVALAGERAGDTYLNEPALLAALADSGADAVHPDRPLGIVRAARVKPAADVVPEVVPAHLLVDLHGADVEPPGHLARRSPERIQEAEQHHQTQEAEPGLRAPYS